jgi:hypothetical protein
VNRLFLNEVRCNFKRADVISDNFKDVIFVRKTFNVQIYYNASTLRFVECIILKLIVIKVACRWQQILENKKFLLGRFRITQWDKRTQVQNQGSRLTVRYNTASTENESKDTGISPKGTVLLSEKKRGSKKGEKWKKKRIRILNNLSFQNQLDSSLKEKQLKTGNLTAGVTRTKNQHERILAKPSVQ